MINPKLHLVIYRFIFGCISGLKGKNYQYFGSSLTSLKQQTPESYSRTPLFHIVSPWDPHFKALRENPDQCVIIVGCSRCELHISDDIGSLTVIKNVF